MFIKTNNKNYDVINYISENKNKLIYLDTKIITTDIDSTIELYSSDTMPILLSTISVSDYEMQIQTDTDEKSVIVLLEPKSIEEIKGNKTTALSAVCTQIIYNGIDVGISDGTTEHFTLDEQDQLNLSGLGLELAAGAEFISWHEDDKTKHCRFYTAADATKIIQSLTVWKSYHITYFRDLRIYINEALNTKEEVEAVEYGMILPDEYKSAVLRYYENILANA